MTIAALQQARAVGLGKRLTSTTLEKVDVGGGTLVGIVRTPPAELAARAGLPVDVYTLARVLASEGYGGAAIGRAAGAVAIGQATWNGAKASKITLTQKLTRSVYPKTAGFYGNQKGKYASTAQDPFAWHGQVARAVLGGDVRSLLPNGSQNYVDPAVWGNRAKKAAANDDDAEAARQDAAYASVMKNWHKDRAWVGNIATIDPYHLLFFYPEKNASRRATSLAQVMEIYKLGKAGKTGPAGGDVDAGILFPVLTLAGLALAGLVML